MKKKTKKESPKGNYIKCGLNHIIYLIELKSSKFFQSIIITFSW